jgi:cholesterol transport system auxiliary component
MKTLAKLLLACPVVALVAGCLSSGERGFQRYYVLEGSGVQAAQARTPRASTLVVAPTTASSFYETQDIVYSRSPGTRAYYQFHAWTERPSRTIGELLVAHLERSGSFKAITRATSGIQGELVLSTHLSEFYHDAATDPGGVRVSVTAELIDPVRRVLVARRTFVRSAPAVTYDAPGAVPAFNQALGAILDDISAWVDGAAPR